VDAVNPAAAIPAGQDDARDRPDVAPGAGAGPAGEVERDRILRVDPGRAWPVDPDRDSGPLLAFVAGEASGDVLVAPVIAAVRERVPQARCVGIAGDRMRAAGCVGWWHTRELSVRGYAEVLRDLPRLLRIRRTLRDRLLADPPAVMVGVDAPDFNLGVEQRLRAAGIPTVQFVSPSIWAWRRERIEQVRAAADRVLLIFPFEKALYDAAGIAADYVGHPLASTIALHPDAAAARARLGLGAGPVVAILPGSRRAEITFIAPDFFGAAEQLARADGAVRFIVPVADPALRPLIDHALALHPRAAAATTLLQGRSHDALEAADVVLVASGTATLEAALFKRPMVIAYRVPRLTWWIMRNRGYLPWIGLPNILANASLVPELWQDAVTPAALAGALRRLLDDPVGAARLRERFALMHEQLLRDTPRLASEAILATMSRRRLLPAGGH
jgi:lipid-A-disaccharide synthase